MKLGVAANETVRSMKQILFLNEDGLVSCSPLGRTCNTVLLFLFFFLKDNLMRNLTTPLAA